MYTDILVPLDGSNVAEQVIPYVRVLGKAFSARIKLFHVFESLPSDVTPQQLPALQGTASRLKQLTDSLKGEGLAVSNQLIEGEPGSWTGDPASLIISEAERTSSTLIAMSTHGRSGITRWALGSTSEKLLHAASNPVLIIRAKEPAEIPSEVTFDTIIVPLDGSALAEQVLPHVVALAGPLRLKVLLVRVTPPAEDYYRYMEYPVATYEDLPKQMDAAAVQYLHEVNEKLSQQGVVVERLLHGDPASAIVDLAHETPNSLVAMTSHGRSGLGRWLLGSVADRVVRHSGGPVLLIRGTEQG